MDRAAIRAELDQVTSGLARAAEDVAARDGAVMPDSPAAVRQAVDGILTELVEALGLVADRTAGRILSDDRLALIRRHPDAPALHAPSTVLIERLPDERQPKDFLDNQRRRVGQPYDESEQQAGVASTRYAMIYGTTAESAMDLARLRSSRLKTTEHGPIRAASWEISLTERAANEVGRCGGLRLADFTSDTDAPSFQSLDKGDADWVIDSERRERDSLVGVILRNELDGGKTVLFDIENLALLYEAGLISITPKENVYSSYELFGKGMMLSRIGRLSRCLEGLCNESRTGFLVRLVGFSGALLLVLRLLDII
jgi:hypothetical protein